MFGFFKKSRKPEFKFTVPEDTACFACDHVVDKGRPILYVSHDADGDWHFLCGREDHIDANAKLISLKNATEIDPTVNELYEMPPGVAAEREHVGSPWLPYKLA